MKISGQQRKAISPIVATVLIIAATLIAAAAILGYVFGIFGSASNTANVAVTSISLKGAGSAPTGTITLTNSGTAAVSTTGVTLTYAGQTCSAAVTSPVTLTAQGTSGATGTITLTGSGCTAIAPSGITFNGYVSLSNGEQASFTGTFS